MQGWYVYVQVDEDYDGRVQDWPDDDSEDSDYTHAAEELAEDAMSDGDLDDIEEQDCDELLEEVREQTGTINSPTRCCSNADWQCIDSHCHCQTSTVTLSALVISIALHCMVMSKSCNRAFSCVLLATCTQPLSPYAHDHAACIDRLQLCRELNAAELLKVKRKFRPKSTQRAYHNRQREYQVALQSDLT